MGADKNTTDAHLCFSYLGRTDGPDGDDKGQVVNLGSAECLITGKILHLTLHSLGWKHDFLLLCFMVVPCLGATHEHMRWDRDGFVEILHENLLPGAERNFATKSADAESTFGTPFDYDSVMHHAVLKVTTHRIDRIYRRLQSDKRDPSPKKYFASSHPFWAEMGRG